MSEHPIVNIAVYQFVTLDEVTLPDMRIALKGKALELKLKGTILLSTEGINAFLAGTADHIADFKVFLATYPEFENLTYKESFSAHQPFNRMLVRLKKEIIPMGDVNVDPARKTAPYLSPEAFKKWYESGKEMVVLDTRNDFEIELGTFKDAIDLGLDKFRDFPEAIDYLPESMKEKPIVTFCTGGIRCEKAAELMAQKGFKIVYQLDGGILNYFEKCGGEFYEGECFVFDQRVALDSELKETKTVQCFDCRTPLLLEALVDGKCPECGSDAISKQAA